MTPEVFASAAAFALVASFTPGPNNAMLLASGVNYGFARTIPHIAGITVGYGIMFAAVAMGVGRFVVERPELYLALKIASAIYLLWLAWKIARSTSEHAGSAIGEPQTFLQAALFQWVNPKGVGMALAASAAFINPAHAMEDLAALSVIMFVASVASASSWTYFGSVVAGVLSDPRRRRHFNVVMALLLVATIWPLFGDQAGAP